MGFKFLRGASKLNQRLTGGSEILTGKYLKMLESKWNLRLCTKFDIILNAYKENTHTPTHPTHTKQKQKQKQRKKTST